MMKLLCLILGLLCAKAANAIGSVGCSEDSVCTPIWLCNNGNISKYGENIIDLSRKSFKQCRKHLKVCCKYEQIKMPEPLPAPQNVCGVRNVNGKMIKVRNGYKGETNYAEYPWMVALFAGQPAEYIGGGSILAPTVILTAAHIVCTGQHGDLVARAGEWDMRTRSEPFAHVDVRVTERICHEHADMSTGRYDIALLMLAELLIFTHHIMPICLPRESDSFQEQHCFVAGWGKTSFNARNNSQLLLATNVPLVKQDVCQVRLRQTRLGVYFQLHPSLMCAGGEWSRDACTGDGGSPLVCSYRDLPGHYYQVGVVSWGLGCAERGVPGVYANVYFLRNWILDKLAERSIDTAQYAPRRFQAGEELLKMSDLFRRA